MKVAVIGANGQLGRDVVDVLAEQETEVVALDINECDITDRAAVFSILGSSRPDAVVNTAAYHNVPDCEKSVERAFMVNAVGPRHLAEACRDIDTPLIHVSTDYVFDGAKKKPYVETDCPHPLNIYGISKLAGEHAAATWEKSFSVRSSGLYGVNPCVMKGGMNFVGKMLALAKEKDSFRVTSDEFLTPTYTRDLARQIAAIIGSDLYGVIHATCEGSCSWYEFAKAIFELSATKVDLGPRPSDPVQAGVRRPTYSVLENARLKEAGLNRMRPWKEALAAYIEAKGLLGSRDNSPPVPRD